MNCLIVDDEPLAVDLIEKFVQKIPFLNLLGKCYSAVEAVSIVCSQKVDLIFLDIQMPNLTGIDFVKSLQNPPLIIFTTAYSNYALDGFELNAIDYLVKPIPFDRFVKAVSKAHEQFQLKNGTVQSQPELQSLSNKYIMVKADYSMVRIDLDRILYIEGLKDYLKIHLKDAKAVLTLSSLKKLETKLPSEFFMRVHRSYIVSLNKIDAIQKHRIIIGENRIPVGDMYKELFYERMEENNLN